MAKEKEHKKMFKEPNHHGEHRNGRKSQYKNSSAHGDEAPDEYVSRKDT
ncbi:hypothetical protein [Ornithinibacillus halophilus]|uniref:Uncharacterized protein n=1 Tax=Ornithinibacillus halophilus TaxID=930117 RepID=A0A1M5GDY2_9BACI|nr:hypothetical protein [Ornithinibacillus halophilus]SHG01975.1 hypothetical protein SAMN05216225_101270 [Ornithinibacillus halophilus]